MLCQRRIRNLAWSILLACLITFTEGVELYVPTEDYPTIQAAVDDALEGDVIIALQGSYRENVTLTGANITLRSTNPEDSAIVLTTIIAGEGNGSVVTIPAGTQAGCTLAGFTITGGNTATNGGGIRGNNSLATIRGCIVRGNQAMYGGGIHGCDGVIERCKIVNNNARVNGGGLVGCDWTITDCVIANNRANQYGGGLQNCDGDIVNCTVVDNIAPEGSGCNGCNLGTITNCIIWNNGDSIFRNSVTPTYSCFPGGSGNGNIDADPGFALPDDYHLADSSLCIDAGTNSPPGGLSATDLDGSARMLGGNADMGAYEHDPLSPCIAASPQQVTFRAVQGETSTELLELLIRNCGGGTLYWEVEAESSWLIADPELGESTGEIDDVGLSVDVGGLDTGQYTTLVRIADPCAANTPYAILVTLYVDNEGELHVPDVYPTIQEAIEVAVDGEIIIVGPGRYYENIDFLGKEITVTSMAPDDPCVVAATIIDARGWGSVVTIANSEGPGAVLRGFTITGGIGTLVSSYPPYTTYQGGGIYCINSSPVIEKNVIRDNKCPLDPEGSFKPSPSGGGIYSWEGSPTISHNTLRGNRADLGGGIHVTSGNPQIHNNMIIENESNAGGGVFYSGQARLTNNTIANNLGYSAVYTTSQGTISNNIIAHRQQGSSLYVQIGGSLDWISYNNVFNSLGTNYSDDASDPTGQNGNISIDPEFVNPNDDYHLSANSPCIDAGDPAYAAEPGSIDIDGEVRIFALRMDIGADEYVGYLEPTANAGPDQHVWNIETVMLDGSDSWVYDPCSTVIYQWTQTDGEPVALSDWNAVQPTFTPTLEGEYRFELIVSDALSSSEPDQVIILVGNRPPVAHIGSRRVAIVGELFTLDGSGSYDPDPGDEVLYQWRQVSGPTVILDDPCIAKPAFICNEEAFYEFEVVVSDGVDSSEPYIVEIAGVTLCIQETSIDTAYPTDEYFHYPDVSGKRVAYAVGPACDYTWQTPCKDLKTGEVGFFNGGGLDTHPKIDGDIMVCFGCGDYPGGHIPECTSIHAWNIDSGAYQLLRAHSNTQSYSYPAVSGSKVVWVEHVGINKNNPNLYHDMPYSICGAEINDFSNPIYFTVAENVGHRDPYPYLSYWRDYSNTVVDLHGNTVVWEADGDIYGADLSNLENIVVFPICLHQARQFDPAVSGDYVVWTDQRNDFGDLYGANISDIQNVQEFAVVAESGIQQQPAIDGSTVVYVNGFDYGHIKACCLTKRHGPFPLPLTEYRGAAPAIDGNILVWEGVSPWGKAAGIDLKYGYSITDGAIYNATVEKEYDYICHAMNCAASGDEIVIPQGVHHEKMYLDGKDITIRSTEPQNPAVVSSTVIHRNYAGAVAVFDGTEPTTCTLAGLTLTGGSSPSRGGGVDGNDSVATIRNCTISDSNATSGGGIADFHGMIQGCLIQGNSAERNGGGMVACKALITNCLVHNNTAALRGGGMHNCDNTIMNCTVINNVATDGGALSRCDGTIINCIFWSNDNGTLFDCAEPMYSCWAGADSGLGNIDADPCFVDAANGDYHLKSEGWRWDAQRKVWTWDTATSPCIDAGNPGSQLGDEPVMLPMDPDNEWGVNLRINMGAYGGTEQASISPWGWGLLCDLNNDGIVDLDDFATQGRYWMDVDDEQPADVNRDGVVDAYDLLLQASDWLKEAAWR